MRVEVALLPSLVCEPERKLCIVVDVLRAATTLAAMATAGAARVVVTADPPSARAIAARLAGSPLLCGESGGLKPEDFDLGNSPSDYTAATLRGRPIVFCSSNGAKALHALDSTPIRLVGAFATATAVSRAAATMAVGEGLDVCVVASGEFGGLAFSLEDTACAGLLVSRLMGLLHGADLDDGARAAKRLFESFRSDLPSGDESSAAARAIDESHAAATLRAWGMGEDVALCAEVDRLDAVMSVAADGGLLVASPLRGIA